MIARIIPGSLDVEGNAVSQPRKKHFFHPTFPIETYLTQPLEKRCSNLDQMRAFLKTCRYVHDKKQFDVEDYWMPPEEFEKRRQGDCDCAAIWAWRQLEDLNYEARYVLGYVGSRESGHAWVFFKEGADWFALEPFAAIAGPDFPRLDTLSYHPRFSASWDGERIRYFEHEELPFKPPTLLLIRLVFESAIFHGALILRVISGILRFILRRRPRKTEREQSPPISHSPGAAVIPSLLRPAFIPDPPPQGLEDLSGPESANARPNS